MIAFAQCGPVLSNCCIHHLVGDFLAKLNYRNHRKIVVIHGKIGYTGGMNINDHYFRQWRDTHLRIEGDAVASLQLIFLNSWVVSGGKRDEPYLTISPKPLPRRITDSSGSSQMSQEKNYPAWKASCVPLSRGLIQSAIRLPPTQKSSPASWRPIAPTKRRTQTVSSNSSRF